MQGRILLLTTAIACGSATPPPSAPPPPAVALRPSLDLDALASALAQACPAADPADEAARRACGERLAALPILRDSMDEPFLWGGQKEAGNVSFADNNLTRFSPYAF